MTVYLFQDHDESNGKGDTLAAAVSAGDSTFTVNDSSKWPSVSTGDGFSFLAVFSDGSTVEIVEVTNRSSSVCTISGTFSNAWSAGTTIQNRVPAQLFKLFAQGADNTGHDALGANAINYQSGRTASDRVASGARAVALGYSSKASGTDSLAAGNAAAATGDEGVALGDDSEASAAETVAVGNAATASGAESIAIGESATANANDGVAVGSDSSASGVESTALGDHAVSRIDKTVNVAGPIIVRKDDGQTDHLKSYAGAEVVIFSDEIDLTTTADDVDSITIPTGATFFPDECGLIVTSVNSVTGQPNIEFGVSGDTDALVTSSATSASAVGERDRFTSLNTDHGQTSLTVSVANAGSGTTFLARGYWKGLLVEDE